MTFILGSRSYKNLEGVHPKLVMVVERAIALSPVDFMVTEGVRTLEKQKKLVAAGASQTLNSKHLKGRAIDVAALVDGEVRWDWPLYSKIAIAMKVAADELGVAVTWGGEWRSLRDGPHFELKDSVV